MLIGFCGVLLILQPRFSGLRLGALAALGAALSEAILGVCLKKLSQPEGACTIIFWSYLSNCVVFGVLSGFRLPVLDMTSCGILLFSGLATLCIFWCFILAYRAGEASAVEVGSFSLLLFSPLLGFVLFGEVPSRLFWLGALVMSCGTFMVWFEPIRPAS